MNAIDIPAILDQHRRWLQGEGGRGANLGGADLGGADLRRANLGRDTRGAAQNIRLSVPPELKALPVNL